MSGAGGGWMAPAYWIAPGNPRAPAAHWQVFGLDGVRPLDRAAPVPLLADSVQQTRLARLAHQAAPNTCQN